MRAGARGGFSLVETLVVLAIASTLLMLVFSVGAGGRDGGFRTARRADALVDRSPGLESLRVLLRGVHVPRRGGDETPLVGARDRLTAAIVPSRRTTCPGVRAGVSTQLRLERRQGGAILVCQAAGGVPVALADLGPGEARFAYALAGRPWSETLAAVAATPAAGTPPAGPPRLWIRLAGAHEIIEAADPGPPSRPGRIP